MPCGLATAIVGNAVFERSILATRRLPLPTCLEGIIARYIEVHDFGMRFVMAVNLDTLEQEFIGDVLYGIGNWGDECSAS